MKQHFYTLITIVVAFFSIACSSHARTKYHVDYKADKSQNGMTAYIVDYDTGDKIDSTLIADGKVSIDGEVGDPVLARLIIDGNRAGVFILEGGDIVISPKTRIASGTPLNDAFTHYANVCDSIEMVYEKTSTDSAGTIKRKQLVKEYELYNDNMLQANADNPIGLYIFLQKAFEMNQVDLEAALAEMPQFASSKRIAGILESLKRASATAIGSPYQDFAVTYNDSTYKLSDYVGRDGKYLLVDFWASWCGPCIKETRTVKELYKRYGDKNLNVLSVAVWDKPEDTERAIKAHKLPWPQIINAGTIPTDLYGISGIPHIMLIDPQGNIVSRGLQGQDLIDEVERACGGEQAEQE